MLFALGGIQAVASSKDDSFVDEQDTQYPLIVYASLHEDSRRLRRHTRRPARVGCDRAFRNRQATARIAQ
jgi:hypothetical protein